LRWWRVGRMIVFTSRGGEAVAIPTVMIRAICTHFSPHYATVAVYYLVENTIPI